MCGGYVGLKMSKVNSLVLLLSPQHGELSLHLERVAKIHGIKEPVAKELEPRAGMRRFEIIPASAVHTCDLQWPHELRSMVFAAHGGSRRT